VSDVTGTTPPDSSALQRGGVAIVGASPQGRVVLATLRAAGVPVAGFLDDDPARCGERVDDVTVLGPVAWWLEQVGGGARAIVAIGNNDTRVAIGARLRAARVDLASAVHPSATVMPGASLGTGCFVAAGVVIVTGTRLGDDVIVNTAATIDHDCLVATGAQIAAGVHTAGRVAVGPCAFIGVGSVLGPGVSVGARSIVGAGSVVLRDVPPDVLAFGTPARAVRRLERPLDWRAILAGE
jgi:sugar O-acyltransferase (sialic acid O-acetyltransferase NeuD family)